MMWCDYDPDPRKSYYLFLRKVYGYEALAAWKIVKQRVPPTPGQIRQALERRK